MQVIAFDIFGTVFDLSAADPAEIKAYGDHIRRDGWSPLHLPKSWELLPAFADAAEGVARLREKYIVVTCSNGPLGLQIRLAKNNGIEWDGVIPLELNKVFKTDPRAYLTICEVLDVQPNEVMMVTANKTFGDLEASRSLGMTPQLIRHDGCPANILELAESLGC